MSSEQYPREPAELIVIHARRTLEEVQSRLPQSSRSLLDLLRKEYEGRGEVFFDPSPYAEENAAQRKEDRDFIVRSIQQGRRYASRPPLGDVVLRLYADQDLAQER